MRPGGVRLTRGLLVLGGCGAVLLLATVVFNLGALFNGTGAAYSAGRPAVGQDALLRRGEQVFRFDTFGDRTFWGGALQLHRAIAGAANGGVGPGVSPKTALAVGLKVDANAIPAKLAAAIKGGKVDLGDPKTTLALLKLNAVVGVTGYFDKKGTLTSMGVTCALCHSTVDNSFAPGIGRRLDGWPNQDLDVGKIISLAPSLKPFTDLLGVDVATVKKVLLSWGPGKFDAELSMDGKAFQSDGRSAATRIPPAFGLAGVNLATYTGWGSVTYWNAFVANLEMHGHGTFFDPRLDDAAKFPVAAKAGFGHVNASPDLITSKLGPLHAYELSLTAPTPPKGSFDPAAAARGQKIFDGKGRCSSCHVPPLYTEPGYNLHKPSETCSDPFIADRSPTGMYRTTPLRGMFAKSKRGFGADGRFPTLLAVVDHYDTCFTLGLTPQEKNDLVQFVKSR
jgi:hypothetical protein